MENLKDINFKKKFGQNFLTDTNLLKAIVSDANVCEDDVVIEIGAGAGALTKELAKKAQKVISFEVDTELESVLKENLKEFDNISIIFEDFLNFDEEKIYALAGDNFKIVANLPYYITTPIITKLFNLKNRPSSIVVMVQKEVGERIVATAKNGNYGYFSAYVKANADAFIVRNVGRKMFTPPPKVDSCIVVMSLKENEYPKEFFEFLKNVFKMKRKTLLNNISASYDINKSELEKKVGKEKLSQRADALDIENLYQLYSEIFS
ncbi:MAG: ribosomal RNA small subunit methyltransferase A [Clostridia bacterium]|nr:ribosomal RNA small subunit methyltransferase A [Clostridia bacterium]